MFLVCLWCVFGVFLVCKLRGEMGEGGGGRGVSVGEPGGGGSGEPVGWSTDRGTRGSGQHSPVFRNRVRTLIKALAFI